MTEFPIIEIDIGQLSPDPSQPRKVFDENAISSLREDIKANGLREPIDINPLLDGRKTKYLIIDGECRFHAIEGIEDFGMVPCKLHTYKSQREIDKHRASKHFHRKDWNPGDRAEWLKYYMTTHKLRQQDLAREFSIRQSTVSEWLAPASDRKVLKALRNEEIGFKQAVLLSRVDDAETRENALLEAIGKTQKQTEEIIAARYSEPETEKEEESETEITEREALIKSVPEDLQERLLDATKDLSLHDTERVVKQVIMGVTVPEAVRAVELHTEAPQGTEEDALTVNDGTEDSPLEQSVNSDGKPLTSVPETTGIVAETLGLTTDEERTTFELEKEEEALGEEKGIAAVEPSPETEKPAKDPFPIMSRVAKEFETIKKMNDDNQKKQIDNLPEDKLKSVWKTRRKTGMECFCQSARWRGKLNGESYEMSKLICIRPCVVDLSVEKISSTKEIENAKSTLSDMKLKIDKNLNLLAKRGG